MQSSNVAAFILAGGQSTRMGRDKALVMLEGRTLLECMLDVARALTPDVQIVGDAEKYAVFAPVVEDVFPGCGPLGGIHAALRSSQQELNLILAVDIPFVSPALLNYLVSRAQNSASLVTVPRAGKGFQPLCAVYRRAFADEAEQALRAGRYKIDALFDAAQIQIIREGELRAAGFSGELFRNLNTPGDLEKPRQ
jgi:molybdenum cofactor guanylyltransferase